jgi:hypothetical protein
VTVKLLADIDTDGDGDFEVRGDHGDGWQSERCRMS